jgi:transposase
MHINRTHKRIGEKVHTSVLLRESIREGDKITKRTLANLTHWEPERIAALEAALKGESAVDLSKLELGETRCFGALFVFLQLSKTLGLTKALGKKKNGLLALMMAAMRPIKAQSKLAIVAFARNQAVKELLGIDQFDENDLYGALDWLEDNQADIEFELFKHRQAESSTLFLYDTTSSYLEGDQNELAMYGYNRDKKKGKKQIVIGLLMDEMGYPVTVEVFKGNTKDEKTVSNQLKKLAERFGVKRICMIGDRGMLKSAQIDEIQELQWNYITAITKPQIESLIKEGTIQLNLFDEKICEVEYGKKRLILKRNPFQQEKSQIGRKQRIEKVIEAGKKKVLSLKKNKRANAKKSYDSLIVMVHRYCLTDVINVELKGRQLTVEIHQNALAEAERLDGCYAIITDLPKKEFSAEVIHQRYKDLKFVEDAFRTLKTTLLEVRPVWHRRADRTKAHVFLCMLSLLLTIEFKKGIKNLDFALEEAIAALDCITVATVHIGRERIQKLPQHLRGDQKAILKALQLDWPKVIQRAA